MARLLSIYIDVELMSSVTGRWMDTTIANRIGYMLHKILDVSNRKWRPLETPYPDSKLDY